MHAHKHATCMHAPAQTPHVCMRTAHKTHMPTRVHSAHANTRVWVCPASPLTIRVMSSSFFTRAGDSTLAARMPRGFAGWADRRTSARPRPGLLPGPPVEPSTLRELGCQGARPEEPNGPTPQLTHHADRVGHGSLVLRKPQGSQLGRRGDDQGLGQGTEALPTHEEGKWVLDADDHAGQGTEQAPGKVQPRTQDGLWDE